MVGPLQQQCEQFAQLIEKGWTGPEAIQRVLQTKPIRRCSPELEQQHAPTPSVRFAQVLRLGWLATGEALQQEREAVGVVQVE